MIAVDLDKDRLKLAKELGATQHQPLNRILIETILGATAGRGARFEVVAPPTVETAIQRPARWGGGLDGVALQVEFPQSSGDVRLRFRKLASAGEYPKCIELMDKGAIKVSP